MAQKTKTTAPTAGRPRNPEVDLRISHAAMDVFGEAGWSGFNFDVIARRAKVGKASLYLRWSSREDLLADAIEHHLRFVEDVDTGTLRGDLVELGSQLLTLYLDKSGAALIRLPHEAGSIPALQDRYETWRRSQILAARGIVRRAIKRGELADDASVTLVMDTLCGAVLTHVLTTPAELRETMRTKSEAYIQELADFVLRAAARP